MAKKRKTELDIEPGAPPAPAPEPEPAPAVPLEQEPTPQDSSASKAPGAPPSKKLLMIIGAVVTVVLAVVIGVTVTHNKKPAAAKKEEGHGEKAKTAEKPKAVEAKFEKLNNIVLAPFVIPYKNNGADGFIQVVFALQVNDPEVIDEINNGLPLIRNSILFAISTRAQTDLIDPAKREVLLKDIRYNIDRSLQTGRVEAVLLNALNVY